MTRRSVFGRIVAGALGALGLGKARAAPVDEWQAEMWVLRLRKRRARLEIHLRNTAFEPYYEYGVYGYRWHWIGNTPPGASLEDAKAVALERLARLEREAPPEPPPTYHYEVSWLTPEEAGDA